MGERPERAPGPVTASGMNCGFVPGERPTRPPDRRRLLLLLAGSCGSLGGRGVLARHCRTALPGGLGVLSPRAPAAHGSASRASALLLLVLVPSPRLAAAAPRRQLGDWERSRREASLPSGGARRCQPGFAPGVACATGALHLCHGRVAALAYSRRGRAGLAEERGSPLGAEAAGRGRASALTSPGGRLGDLRSPGCWGVGTKVSVRPWPSGFIQIRRSELLGIPGARVLAQNWNGKRGGP